MSTPLVKPFPLKAGHPANHGYSECSRCGTWRAPGATREVPSLGGPVTVCIDATWCSEQAKALGRLEGP